MNKKRSIVKYLTAVLISILFLTNCYTQLHSTKNDKSNYVSSKTTIVQEYDDLEIKIRMFLHEEYHPGSCYGMPHPVDERIIKSTLKNEGFKFLFTDGNCCVITRYEGILYMNNDVIIRSEIISKKVTKTPC